MLFGYQTRRKLKRRIHDLEQEVEHFKFYWQKDYDRFVMYKARVIELNGEVEALREELGR